MFRYKDLLGLHFENTEGRNGFILFGYYNSTDPKHIYNIKKEGLNYENIWKIEGCVVVKIECFKPEK